MNCSSWRMQADMLSQLAALPLCLPCNAVHDLLIPRLWHRIETMVILIPASVLTGNYSLIIFSTI